MRIAILLFDRLTALDAVGPYEVLSASPAPSSTSWRPSPGPSGPTPTGSGSRRVARSPRSPRPTWSWCRAARGNPLLRDEPVLAWLRSAHEGTRFTSSVCTGALVLGAAGILDGLRATTHWAYLDTLSGFGATPVGERVVEDGKVITAAGVSSGIDMALHLAAKLAGEDAAKAIQLGIEYDPEPRSTPARRARRPTTWSRRFASSRTSPTSRRRPADGGYVRRVDFVVSSSSRRSRASSIDAHTTSAARTVGPSSLGPDDHDPEPGRPRASARR